MSGRTVCVVAMALSACGESPPAPSITKPPVYSLQLSVSSSCTKSGAAYLWETLHVTGSFVSGRFVMVKENLGPTDVSFCGYGTPFFLQTTITPAGSVSGTLCGTWHDDGCYSNGTLDAHGTITGIRNGNTASGTFDGDIGSTATYQLNLFSRCSASEHRWSLTPIQ